MDKRYQFKPKLGQYMSHALDTMERNFLRDAEPRKHLSFLKQSARRAVKFTVPECPPYPIDDVLEPQDYRPPYPVTVFEVDKVRAEHEGERYEGALVTIAIDRKDRAEIHFLFGDTIDDPSTHGWSTSFFRSIFYYDPEMVRFNDRGMPCPIMEIIPTVAELFVETNAHMDMTDVEGMKHDLMEQLAPMLQIYTAICYAMRNNVTTTVDVPPDAKQNRVRRIRNQMPLFTYKTLVIGEAKPKVKTRKGGTHASPRSHLRRGHYRTSKNGLRYWVSAAFVNGNTPGFVHKDYELKLGAQ